VGAQVTLTPSDKIRFTPHPQHDLAELDSIQHLADSIATQGYHGASTAAVSVSSRCSSLTHPARRLDTADGAYVPTTLRQVGCGCCRRCASSFSRSAPPRAWRSLRIRSRSSTTPTSPNRRGCPARPPSSAQRSRCGVEDSLHPRVRPLAGGGGGWGAGLGSVGCSALLSLARTSQLWG
jgi:hypothetical protein